MSSGGVPAATGGLAVGQYVSARTSVWWDIENCQVPRMCDPHLIAQNVSSALAAMDYRGAVTISAYGDTNKINQAVQQALSSTGISLNHVPAGVKDASDKKILVDMLFWAVDNPPPANYLLISGDRDFSNALHQLRMRRYNILLAQPASVSQALVAAATSVWLWTSLLVGGPPLSKIPHINNAPNSRPTVETSGSRPQTSTKPAVNQKNHNNSQNSGKTDNRNKGKQSQKTHNQQNPNKQCQKTPNQQNPNTQKAMPNGSQEGKQPKENSGASGPKCKAGTKKSNHASSSTESGSGAQKSAQKNKSKSKVHNMAGGNDK